MATIKLEIANKKFEYTNVYKDMAQQRFKYDGHDFIFYLTKSEDWGWNYGCKRLIDNTVIFYDPCGLSSRNKRRAEQLVVMRFKELAKANKVLPD